MLSYWFADLGASFVDLPAHDDLWRVVNAIKHEHLAQLAIGPLVLEARGSI